MDYRVDLNTGLLIVRWMDNSIVQLASNFVGIKPMGTLNRWDSHGREKKYIACPKIVTMYNKSMGGVDLADLLIALYRIQCKTKCWYIKVFWHMVDIAKVNALILYKKEEILCCVSEKSLKCLKMFSLEIANVLIHAMMPESRSRPSKRKSTEAVKPQLTLWLYQLLLMMSDMTTLAIGWFQFLIKKMLPKM